MGPLKCTEEGMGNKEKELEAIVQQDSCDLVAITETWCDDSHDCSAAMDGYKLFRRDRRGRRGDGVVLRVRECFARIELNDCDDKVEFLCVKVRGKSARQISCWESVIENPTSMKRKMKHSTSGWQQSHNR